MIVCPICREGVGPPVWHCRCRRMWVMTTGPWNFSARRMGNWPCMRMEANGESAVFFGHEGVKEGVPGPAKREERLEGLVQMVLAGEVFES